MDILQRRDVKGLYSAAQKGDIQNVVGVDLPFNEPTEPDLIIDNDGSSDPENISSQILEALSDPLQ
jgi:adenylylsulfate kinase-like enzyme